MWHRIACASLLVILSWGQLAYAAPVTADPAQVKGLLDTLHQPAKKSRMRPGSDGFIRFVGTAPDNHFVVNTPASSSPEDVARQFLTDHEAAFTSKSLHTNYILRRTSRSHGNSFVHVGQTYMGLDVFGSGMVIQVNEQGGVACVVSDLLRDTTPLETGAVPVTASMASASARQMALDWMAAEHGYDAHQFQSTPPQLIIFDPQLVGAPGQLTLAWKTAVWLPNAPVAEDVLIDARSGQVVFHYSLAHDAKTRTIYDANSSSTTATLVRSEGQGPCAVADANAAYDYFGHTYDFYLNAHARLSIDNADMTMVAIVRYCDPEQCPMQNAFWSGTENRMYFGAGFVVDDVVAHELTHGVTQYESGLIYYGQSGAINEALSDIWGEFVDLGNAQGNDAASVRWLMGEDLPSGAIRDMENPPAYYQPDKMTSAYYYEGAADNGGVHINSGVANKMCFLLTDGGTFNGQTVQAMGIPLVADLFYEVQTNLLTPSSGFLSLYSALEQAAINLSFTNEQRNNILAAGQAVEIDDAPPSLELANVWWSDQIDTDEDGYYSSMTLNLDCDMPGSTEPISAYAETYYYDDELDDWIFWMQTPTFSVTGETDEDTMSMPIYPHAYGEYDYAVIVWRENAETPDTVVFPEDGDDLWGHPEELMDEDGATPTISLAEALDAPLLTWSSDTPRPWVGQALISHDAEDAARSYPIPDDGYCTMSTSLTGPGMLSFWWKVSCEENFDFLWLTIDGQTVDLVTGEQDWTQVTGVVIPQGTHEVTWIYSKDFMWSAGHDCGWVDQVVYERDRCAVSLIANPSDGGTITPDLPPDTEGKYEYGAVLSLLATAHEGYTFSSWSGAATGSDNPVEVTVTADITVTANFLPKRQLTLIVSPQASGTITADPLPDDDGKYASGTTVTLTANPNPGYTFGAWSGAATGPTASVQVTMDANKTVTATFVPKRTLTLTVEPADAGTIVANPPPGVDGKYVYGTVVTVTANANTGYSFGSWSGAAGGMSTSVQLIMNTDKALTAHFVPDRTLSLAVSPLSAGTITANPPPNPNGKYTSGTTVILTATPASAYTFGAWSGQATGTDISTEIIMDADKAVTATFLPKCTLTLATTPEASGTVTASPLPGADGKYVYGTIVKLTAQAGTGYSFGAWNGDATGSTLTTYVTMDANKTVTAAFVQRFSLALTASPAAGGSFSISPAPGGDGKYAHGTVVTATAKPAVGFEFSAWTGNATGTTNPLQITVNANKNVTANFARRFALSSTCNPLTGGTIIQNPLPGADGLYSAGTMVTLTATPRSGYSFGAWSGGGATGTVNPIQVTVDATKTVTASFIPRYTLTATATPANLGSLSISPPPGADGRYLAGTVVTLTPVPNEGYSFSSWTGDATDDTEPLEITVNANKTISANFVPRYSLTVATSPTSGGTVVASMQPDADGKYKAGTTVTLTAEPADGYSFDAWSGHAAGSSTTAPILINANKSILATFVPLHKLSLSSIPADAGDIVASPPPDDHGRYAPGTMVTLTPKPKPGYAFHSWMGHLSGSADPADVIMNGSKTITASFYQSPLVAVVQDVQWSNELDRDGDGYCCAMMLSWNADVAGGTGSLSVYAKVYQRQTGDEPWEFVGYTPSHTITDSDPGDGWGIGIQPRARGQYDYRIEIIKQGQSEPDAIADALEYEILSGHYEELPSDDEAAPTPVSCPGAVNKSIKESTFPLDIFSAPSSKVAPSASLSARITADTAIDPDSVWATVQQDGAEHTGTVQWTPADSTDACDGWITFTSNDPLSGLLTLTCGANTVDAQDIAPVTRVFNMSEGNVQPNEAVLIEQDDVPGAASSTGCSPVYRIEPVGVFAEPVTVQIAAPEGTDAESIDVYYYSESLEHQGWYHSDAVQGWMVHDSVRLVERDGQTVIEFLVRHSGIVQLRPADTITMANVRPSLPDLMVLGAVLLAFSLLANNKARPRPDEAKRK